jgi:NADH-quinone oxidoreductase subunit H
MSDPFGLLQPLADGAKFLLKEDLTPPHVYKPLYIAAPMLSVIFALTSIAVIPIGNWVDIFGLHIPLQITDLNIGPPYHSGCDFDGRVWSGTGGLVLEQ